MFRDICHIHEEDYEIKYDPQLNIYYKSECEKRTCKGEAYSYACFSNFCSPDKSNCDEYKFDVHRSQIDVLNLQIKSCLKRIRNKEHEACILRRTCIKKEKKIFQNTLLAVLKTLVECPCPTDLAYGCNGTTFCARYRFTCNEIQRLNNISRLNVTAKYCLSIINA